MSDEQAATKAQEIINDVLRYYEPATIDLRLKLVAAKLQMIFIDGKVAGTRELQELLNRPRVSDV